MRFSFLGRRPLGPADARAGTQERDVSRQEPPPGRQMVRADSADVKDLLCREGSDLLLHTLRCPRNGEEVEGVFLFAIVF